jgi:hypothetical protein
MRLLLTTCLIVALLAIVAYEYMPEHLHAAPKIIQANGISYLACEGWITVYSPSREIASSSPKSYEITFYDGSGTFQDLKGLGFYAIVDAPGNAHYDMPIEATPKNMSKLAPNGSLLTPGQTVLYGYSDDPPSGRAIWDGPGKWKSVPCSNPLQQIMP